MRMLICTLAACAAPLVSPPAEAGVFDVLFGTPTLVEEWRYAAPSGETGSEIVAFDAVTQRVFVSNAADGAVDVLDATDGSLLASIPVGEVNSVATFNGLVAIGVHSGTVGVTGTVILLDAATLTQLSVASAGFLPDMVTFTPDGTKVLVANEGEPNDDYDVDPVGSISVIDVTDPTAPVTTDVDFASFNGDEAALKAAGVRIFGPNATVAQDLEPEYIAVSSDSKTAYVTCQENNAVAVVDLDANVVLSINPLGYKDHTKKRNAFDASNEDDGINIRRWPTKGMYMPDSLAAIEVLGVTLIVSANEGDARDYDGFSEEIRVKNLDLDPSAFKNIDDLQEDENLGRLNTTTATGDADGDGLHEEIYSYGARSFSIWWFSPTGKTVQIYDSGDDFEQITAVLIPDDFNSNQGSGFDSRSDDKGPEPEAIDAGTDLGQSLCFIGLERTGGIMVYDITNPKSPKFIEYSRNLTDIGPEGIKFIPRGSGPFTEPAIVAAHEVSGTTTLFRVKRVGGLLSGFLND